jgi:NADP-dependent 3-hydroxy acid dehydrogenase YdfG
MMSPGSNPPRRVLVTGASSGIGAATARRLAADGWYVIAAARRMDRLTALADGAAGADGAGRIEAAHLDVTSDESVAALAAHLADTGGLDALVNNAGGAFGADRVEDASVERWQRMYEINVTGSLRVTTAMLPLLRASAARTGGSDIAFVTSTAAYGTYEGGSGYTAAKHAERMLATTLKWELAGEPLRVVQIAPGLVKTDEFALVRYDGDAARAAALYEGLQNIDADDVADAIAWMISRPAHVSIDELVIRPRAQANHVKTVRTGV